jgi:hypothetical protein
MQSGQRLYERLGIRPQDVDAEFQIRMIEKTKAFNPDAVAISSHKLSLVSKQAYATLACYLEDNFVECTSRARDLVVLAEDLFFGRWREAVPDPKHGGRYPADRWLTAPWVDEYRETLLWCTCLGGWKSARRLSQYPRERTVDNVSERKSEAPWYQLLAAYLRGDTTGSDFGLGGKLTGEPSAKLGSSERLIEEGRSKRLKLLSAMLRAIAAKDAATAQERIEQYLVYYRKNEFPTHNWDEKVAIDGTILVHLAEHEGLNVKVPPAYADYIVRLPSDDVTSVGDER